MRLRIRSSRCGRVVSGDEDSRGAGKVPAGQVGSIVAYRRNIRVREDHVSFLSLTPLSPPRISSSDWCSDQHGPMSSVPAAPPVGASWSSRRAPDPLASTAPDIVKQRAEHAAATDSTAEMIIRLLIWSYTACGRSATRKRAVGASCCHCEVRRCR